MSVKQRIVRTVGFLIDCGLFLLLSYTLTAMAATWTDVSGKRAGFSVPFIDLQTGFPDWRGCQQACATTPNCSMFEHHHAQCQLSQGGHPGVVLGVLKQSSGISGQIDANGALVWLGIGRAAFPHQSLNYAPDVQSVATCRQKCDSPDWNPPCLAVEWRSTTNSYCLFHGGYFDETQMTPSTIFDSAIKQPDLPDPNGHGTRIAASKLPPPPAPLNGAVPPYVLMPKGMPAFMASLQSDVAVQDVTECATLCHTTDNCHSFIFKLKYPTKMCDLFDYAVKGVIVAHNMNQYGIIDRDGPPGNVDSIIPTYFSIQPSNMKTVTETSLTVDGCATLCYEHHEPFYCTMFELVNNITCSLYTIDYFHHLNSTLFAEPPAGTVYGRIDDGRRAFHHPTDNAEPIRQMDGVLPPTTTTTTTTDANIPLGDRYVAQIPYQPNATRPTQVFNKIPGVGGQSYAPKETLIQKNKLLCAICCHQRDWCVGFTWNMDDKECVLVEAE